MQAQNNTTEREELKQSFRNTRTSFKSLLGPQRSYDRAPSWPESRDGFCLMTRVPLKWASCQAMNDRRSPVREKEYILV